MPKPTEAQIKEFWEGIGFKFLSPLGEIKTTIAPNGSIWWEETVDIDLISLSMLCRKWSLWGLQLGYNLTTNTLKV